MKKNVDSARMINTKNRKIILMNLSMKKVKAVNICTREWHVP